MLLSPTKGKKQNLLFTLGFLLQQLYAFTPCKNQFIRIPFA